jgi:hypothetical protein
MVLAAGKVWCSPSSPCSRRSEALRVAPGGSAPPIPSAARRDMLSSGRDGKAGASTELESWPGSGRKVHCIHNYHCPTLRGCHVLLCACDISNGEKKCLFKRAATWRNSAGFSASPAPACGGAGRGGGCAQPRLCGVLVTQRTAVAAGVTPERPSISFRLGVTHLRRAKRLPLSRRRLVAP